MKKNNYGKVIAMCSTGGNTGIGIIAIEYGIEDKAVTTYFNGTTWERVRKNIIKYDNDGNTYINKHGQKFLISDFLKTDF